jgi:DNA ligase-1
MQYEEAKIAEKYEGIMARNGEGKYLFGYRSIDLQKVKRFVDAEYKVIGFTEGSAVEMGAIVFVCETPDGQQFSVRPTGTHEERKEWFLNGEAFIGKMLTVKYQELSIDGVPRFPVGLHFREDWDMGGE